MEVCPESLGAMLEYRYIERGQLSVESNLPVIFILVLVLLRFEIDWVVF